MARKVIMTDVKSRGRNWSFIGYPGDSLPDDYQKILNSHHLQWAESPIHSPDPDEETGRERKKHIHFYITFGGHKSFDQVKVFSDLLHGTIPVQVSNPKGMIRYFAHLDDPEKEQFSPDEILCHGGLDISDYLRTSMTETRKMIFDIINYVEEYNIISFSGLVKDLRDHGYYEWLDIVTMKNTLFFSAYMKDRYFISKEGGK